MARWKSSTWLRCEYMATASAGTRWEAESPDDERTINQCTRAPARTRTARHDRAAHGARRAVANRRTRDGRHPRSVDPAHPSGDPPLDGVPNPRFTLRLGVDHADPPPARRGVLPPRADASARHVRRVRTHRRRAGLGVRRSRRPASLRTRLRARHLLDRAPQPLLATRERGTDPQPSN